MRESCLVFIRSCPVVNVLYIYLTSLIDLMGESQQALMACHLMLRMYHLLSKRYTVSCVLVIWVCGTLSIYDKWKYTCTVVTHSDSIQKQLLSAKQGRGLIVSGLDSESCVPGY